LPITPAGFRRPVVATVVDEDARQLTVNWRRIAVARRRDTFPFIRVPMKPCRRNLDRKVKTALKLVHNPACVPHIAKKSFLFGKLDRKNST
jgi:hypothetical protein